MFINALFHRLDQIIIASAEKYPENQLIQGMAQRVGHNSQDQYLTGSPADRANKTITTSEAE